MAKINTNSLHMLCQLRSCRGECRRIPIILPLSAGIVPILYCPANCPAIGSSLDRHGPKSRICHDVVIVNTGRPLRFELLGSRTFGQYFSDDSQELLVRVRLGQEAIDIHQASSFGTRPSQTTAGNDSRVGIEIPQSIFGIQSIHAGHHHVQQHHVDFMAAILKDGNCLGATTGRKDSIIV